MVNYKFYKKDNSKEKLKYQMYIVLSFPFFQSYFQFNIVDYKIISQIQDWMKEVEQEW